MKITLINGGRGASSFINYLLKNNKYELASIVNAYDDGKSTGTIRDFFNILGPSDIRKVQSLFLNKNDRNYEFNLKLFSFRFDSKITNTEAKEEINKLLNHQKNQIIDHNIFKNQKYKKLLQYLKLFKKKLILLESTKKQLFNFSDCSIINCIYAGALLKYKNNIEKSIKSISSVFKITSMVLVNSNSKRYLYGIRANGEILDTEKDIVEIRSNEKIDEIYLLKKKISLDKIKNYSINKKKQFLSNLHSSPQLSKLTKKNILNTDYLFFCPGTQHSSLFPTYLTKNFLSILRKSKAKKIYITNIGADYETPDYKASDYINGALKYLNKYDKVGNDLKLFDYIFINNPKNSNKNYVKVDHKQLKLFKMKIIIDNFEYKNKNGLHDSSKIFKYLKF